MSKGAAPRLFDFKIGDLVWAKMESFTPWPAKIVDPPPNIPKPKKGGEQGTFCVFFFGSNNYSYIKIHNLKPYLQFKNALANSNKTSSFKNAVAQIEKYVEQKEKLGHDFDPMGMVAGPDPDAEFNKLQNEASSSTPKEKPKKKEKDAVKRRQTEPVAGRSYKKARILASTSTDEANSTVGSSGSKPHRRGGYHNLLDRPSMFSRPVTPPLDLHAMPQVLVEKTMEPSKLTFGFLGCGAIGSCIIKNLKVSGHNVVVWNRSIDKLRTLEEELGIRTVQTPQDVIQQADITFSCVSDITAIKNIVFGNCGVLKADLTNKGYVEMTGIDNETSLDIADAINGAGGKYLEAQLLGNRNQAEYGTMIVIAAGDHSLFRDCNTCFKVIARHSFHLKEIGDACKMSLVFNLITGISIAGLAEGLALADRVGIQQSDVNQILKQTRLACPELLEKCENIISDPYVKNFPLKHMQKYLRLALNMADPMDQSLPLTATTNEIYKHTKRLGYSDFDVSSTVYSYAEFGHKLIRADPHRESSMISNIGSADETAEASSAEENSINESMDQTVIEENGVNETEKTTKTLDEVVLNNGTEHAANEELANSSSEVDSSINVSRKLVEKQTLTLIEH